MGATQTFDAVALDGLSEPVRLAFRDDDLGVMQQPVDSSRGETSGKIMSYRAVCRLDVAMSEVTEPVPVVAVIDPVIQEAAEPIGR